MSFSAGRAWVMQIYWQLSLNENLIGSTNYSLAAWLQVRTPRRPARQQLICQATRQKLFSFVDQHLDFSSYCSGFSARPALQSDPILSWVHKAGAAWLSTMPCGLRGCCGFSMGARKRKKKTLTSNQMQIFRKKKSTTAVRVDGNVGRRTTPETSWLWKYGNKDGLVSRRQRLDLESQFFMRYSCISTLQIKEKDGIQQNSWESWSIGVRLNSTIWQPDAFLSPDSPPRPKLRLLFLQSDQLHINCSHCLLSWFEFF